MAILVIGEKEEQEIKAVINYARKHIVNKETMLKMKSGEMTSAGDSPEHVVILGNHRVVFSLEEQGPGLYKHISVTVPLRNGNSYPGKESLIKIMGLFGFKTVEFQPEKPTQDVICWKESVGRGVEAVNLLEKDDYIPQVVPIKPSILQQAINDSHVVIG